MLYHLDDIEKIRSYEKIQRKKGHNVFDISHWDSGNEYNKSLSSILDFNCTFEPFDYIYSYEIDQKVHYKVQKELIGTSDDCTIFFPNSTIAIVNICNFLQKKQINNICVLQPAYFTVGPCLRSFGINTENESLLLQNGVYRIPLEKIMRAKYDAVWITSPIFCTSTYYSQQEIDKLQLLLDKGYYVICDESLSIKEYSLRHQLTNNERLLSLYSPHKVIGTNTIKFSCLICNDEYENFFDQWTDLFSGGLSNSSKIAINHFLTPNYYKCLDFHTNYTNSVKKKALEVISINNVNGDMFFSHSIGQYMTIFYPSVPYHESTKQTFIRDIIFNTKVSLLPGYLEGFYEEMGFCFRVNLTLDESRLITSLNKVLKYINANYL